MDFSTVTELSGDEVSNEQIARLAHRYYWAGEYCRERDVLEVACGPGQGLGYLASVAKTIRGGDITPALVAAARKHYGSRIAVDEMDAQNLPFEPNSLDVVILFEAIYYLPQAERFVDECVRVLRPGGYVLLATANKDLYDFNPSPFSHRYYGVADLNALFGSRGFECRFFGHLPADKVSLRQRILRPVKKFAVTFNLIPKTMGGKKLLKRLVFGRLQPMIAEVDAATAEYMPPQPLPADRPDSVFKVIYMAAKKPSSSTV